MDWRLVLILTTCFAVLQTSKCFCPTPSRKGSFSKRVLLSICSKDGDALDEENTVISFSSSRRTILRKTISFGSAFFAASSNVKPADAALTKDTFWPLWTALPVAPYSKRRTIRYDLGNGVWAFDQLIGIYYVHVPIRMTVVRRKGGLLVFAPVAPTRECLSLLQELIDEYGPILDIILPSVAVEHK